MIPSISTINLLQLASGDRLSIQVYKFSGSEPGKKAYLQANLHGAEIVGNAVIQQLIEFFRGIEPEEIAGEIWLVPVCNPLATNQRTHFFSTGRFNSYDGKDWNRIFWDYEKECEDLDKFARSQINLDTEVIRNNYLNKIQKAFEEQQLTARNNSSVPYNYIYRERLQSLCLDANYVIDIHSSSNQAIDYIYCFCAREESAKYFLLDYGILLNEYDGDAFDEAFIKPWLALEKKLANLGRKIRFDLESWTLELGSGMEMNPDSVKAGVKGIKNYLAYKGILKLPDRARDYTEIKLIDKTQIKKYYAPTGGMIQNTISLKKNIKAGETIYQIISFERNGQLPKVIDIQAEADGLVFDISTNQSVNQGEYVLSIMEK